MAAVREPGGDTFVTGWAFAGIFGQPGAGEKDVFVARYSPEGELLWVRLLGTTGPDEGRAVALAPGGGVYVTGYVKGVLAGQPFAGDGDLLVARLAGDGEVQWAQVLGTAGDDRGRGLTVDPAGAVYVVGYASRAVVSDGGDGVYLAGRMSASPPVIDSAGSSAVLAALDAGGSVTWGVGISGATSLAGLAVDGAGSLFFAGWGNNGGLREAVVGRRCGVP